MSDSDLELEDDHNLSTSHSKLLEAVRELDKTQRIRKPERTEPSLQVSEFHLVKSGISDKNTIQLLDLAKTLGKKGFHHEITKEFNRARNKAKVLEKPLEKPAAERIKRKVGFTNVKKELGKWDGIVARNRTVESITFPLQRPSMNRNPQKEVTGIYRLKSDLEKELENLEPKNEEVKDEKEEFSMTLEELIERRKEAAKLRAQESYKAAKAHRKNKIKSKKFHRVQRKEKLKKQIQELEELHKTNPEAALEKLEILDKIRAKERMSLRHKNTSQWAKNKQVRAKYDKESRQALAEQLSISRELTQKIQKNDESDEDDERVMPACVTSTDKDNPWINGVKTESEIDEFITNYKKFWAEKNNEKKESEEVISMKNHSNEIDEVKLPASMNPVENVIVYWNEKCSESTKNEEHSEKPKASDLKITKTKKNVKISKSKIMKGNKTKLQLAVKSTSQWNIESVDSKENEKKTVTVEDIDDLFDTADNKINNRVDSKLKHLQDKLKHDSKKEKQNRKRSSKESNDYSNKLDLKQTKLNPIINEPMLEVTESNDYSETNVNEKKISEMKDLRESEKKSKEAEIDPNKYINMKTKYITTKIPNVENAEALDDSDNEEDQYKIISEAFADDDVVDEFKKEKEEEIKKGQSEDIDLSLPGWGSWGGKNIVPSARKRKRFMIKFPKDIPRKDENKGDVIIIEENNAKIRKHQVSEVPFPFKTVKDFEASMRAPVGRHFVPEKVHRRLIEPSVKTKIGKIIEPMNEDMLVSKLNKKKKWFL